VEYKGKLYAKIGGKYIECTQSVEDLEGRISNLEHVLNIYLQAGTKEERRVASELAKMALGKAFDPEKYQKKG